MCPPCRELHTFSEGTQHSRLVLGCVVFACLVSVSCNKAQLTIVYVRVCVCVCVCVCVVQIEQQ